MLDLFRLQYEGNEVYRNYCNSLGIDSQSVNHESQIPYLPISAFKYHDVQTGDFIPEICFYSSGTTHSDQRSKHCIRHLSSYLSHTEKLWNTTFGSVEEYCFLALLPGYLEREGSSLIAMMHHFIQRSKYTQSGFFLNEFDKLQEVLKYNELQNISTVLFGVSYALLDFCHCLDFKLGNVMVMETGGMKGTREELPKVQLHKILMDGFGVKRIFSEYGMTELMSQAYSKGNGLFEPSSTLKVHTCQINDPLEREMIGKPGIIAICDTANIDSACFILTEDIGVIHPSGEFEIVGRLDNSELRGCNLLV